MTASFIPFGTRRLVGAVMVGALSAVPCLLHAQKSERPAITARAAGVAVVRSVTRSMLPRGERLTVELSQEAPYFSERVPGPDRVYFDFNGSTVGPSVIAAAQALGSGPLVGSIRLARHSEQTTRLVFTLKANSRYSAFAMYNPFRIAIDIETDSMPTRPPDTSTPTLVAPAAVAAPVPVEPTPPTEPASSPASAPMTVEAPAPPAPSAPPVAPPKLKAQGSIGVPSIGIPSSRLASVPPPATLPHGDYSLARQLGLRVSRIVIDAGHGGHDPGAQSNGITESQLVLDVALRVEQLLKAQPGVEIVLTRSTDEFIPLEERTAIANREGADLFLSIHANASRRAAAQGVETYFLNFATNPAAEAVAARENATSSRTMGNLPELVKTIALNNKVVESRELATIVQTTMVRRLRLQNKAVRDLGVKQAPFVVLIGAQMPSVLAEISFVTNKPEASLLKQGAYRQRIAQSLADAVLRYQSSLKKAAAVAVRAQER